MWARYLLLTLALLALANAATPEPPNPCPAYSMTCPRTRYNTMWSLVNVVDPGAVCITREQFLAVWDVHASPGLKTLHAGADAELLLSPCYSGPNNDLLCISHMYQQCNCIPNCRSQSYADKFINNVLDDVTFGV